MTHEKKYYSRLDALIVEEKKTIGFWPAVRAIFEDASQALSEMPSWERGLHFFWLFGPIILLVERTPADFWLSFIAICFLVKSIFYREFAWLKHFWVRAGFVFWSCCVVSAALSANPIYSLGEAAVWIRFPLFAMATVFWLGSDKRLLYAMLVSTVVGLFIMCGILTAELIIVGQQGGRLTWPYGDPLPGSYVSKVGLPVFTVMVALAVSVSGQLAVASGLFAFVTLVISLMTGERINFLIRACGGMLAGLLWRPRWRRYVWLVVVEIAAVFLLFRFMPDLQQRFVNRFIEQLPTNAQSPYAKAMLPAVEAFYSSPILGIGPGNLRHLCPEIIAEKGEYACHPHPHNFYIQLLGETGIFGFILGSLFIGSIIWGCFYASLKNRKNVVNATAWVIPFGLFWPIASTADFFGQWNNIFLWSAIALALCVTHEKCR